MTKRRLNVFTARGCIAAYGYSVFDDLNTPIVPKFHHREVLYVRDLKTRHTVLFKPIMDKRDLLRHACPCCEDLNNNTL